MVRRAFLFAPARRVFRPLKRSHFLCNCPGLSGPAGTRDLQDEKVFLFSADFTRPRLASAFRFEMNGSAPTPLHPPPFRCGQRTFPRSGVTVATLILIIQGIFQQVVSGAWYESPNFVLGCSGRGMGSPRSLCVFAFTNLGLSLPGARELHAVLSPFSAIEFFRFFCSSELHPLKPPPPYPSNKVAGLLSLLGGVKMIPR